MEVKVSVIVPVYNVSEYLEKCVKSIVNQSFKEIEVILVNDGSTDNSPQIMEELKKEYPKYIKNYTKENGGLGSARNFGLKKATGKYIIFVDSDDWVETNMVEDLFNIIEKNKLDIVLCDHYLDYGTSKEVVGTNIKEGYVTEKEYLMLPFAAWNKIYRRELLIKINYQYPDKLWYEDLATNPQICIYTNKIYYFKKPLYNYFQRPGSIMNNLSFNSKVFNIIEAINTFEDEFKKNNKLETYKEEIEYNNIIRYLYIFPQTIVRMNKDIIKNIKVFASEIRNKYPLWKGNKYYQKLSRKEKLLCNLFYYNFTNIYLFIYKTKKVIKRLFK